MKTETDAIGQATLRMAIIAGATALTLALAGTGWFGMFQSRQLRIIFDYQTVYMKLVESRASIAAIKERVGDSKGTELHDDDMPGKLRLERIRLADIGRSDLIPPQSTVAGWLRGENIEPGPINTETLGVMLVELDEIISTTGRKIATSNEGIVTSLHLYLVFIILMLFLIVLTGGRLLISNYRHSLLPLNMLAQQLSQLNKNIPESVHDTAEAACNILTEPAAPSAEIRYVTESVAGLCRDIEEKNKKLDELFILDEKTGLYNYRHFKEHLIIDVERAKRSGSNISMAMIDIDFFKKYNDAYGHIAGDRVLAKIAAIIREQCRSTDIPSRFGGEEFALLFPETNREETYEIAERLRQVISAEPFDHERQQPGGQLTVSIGIAAFPDDAPDWYSLINNADHALYEAKEKGRNQVVVFDSSQVTEELKVQNES
jgi:diguanylate cyclase (GGDEF)-like protein